MAGLGFSSRERAASFADSFISHYLTPAFGARSKTEVDNLVFALLVEAGAVDPAARPFEIAQKLNITIAKAKALVVTWQMRRVTTHEQLEERLLQQFTKLRFQKDGTYVALGIGDTLVREYFVSELQNLEIYPDRSFAGEIVRVPLDGFLEYIARSAKKNAVDAVRTQLIKAKITPDTSAKGIIKEVVVKAAQKIGEKAVGKAAETAVDKLGDFISGLFSGDAGKAATAASDLI